MKAVLSQALAFFPKTKSQFHMFFHMFLGFVGELERR